MNSKDSIDSRKRRMAGPLDKAEGVYLYEQLPYESQNGYLGGSMIEWAFTTPASDRLRLQNSCIAVRYKIEKSDTKLSSATDYYYDSTLQASRQVAHTIYLACVTFFFPQVLSRRLHHLRQQRGVQRPQWEPLGHLVREPAIMLERVQGQDHRGQSPGTVQPPGEAAANGSR